MNLLFRQQIYYIQNLILNFELKYIGNICTIFPESLKIPTNGCVEPIYRQSCYKNPNQWILLAKKY